MATGVQMLLLAVLGALGTTAGFRVASDWLLSESDIGDPSQLARNAAYFGSWPGQRTTGSFCPWADIDAADWRAGFGIPPTDPVLSVPYRVVVPFASILKREIPRRVWAYYVFGGIWSLLVWSLLGGTMSRMAVVQFAREQRLEIPAALPFARRHVIDQMSAALAPLLVVFLIALPLILLGLLMRMGFGALMGGVLWLVVILVSLVIAVILFGLLFSWPLMWAAISADNSDAFDAVSRGYSYAFGRPLRYLGYVLFAALVGILGWLVVWLISELVVSVSFWSVSLGAGQARMDEFVSLVNGSREAREGRGIIGWGAACTGFWIAAVRAVASGYSYAFFWCAMAGIYLLLRLDVDATEMDEIYSEEDAGKYSMPPLAKDSSGVPIAAEETESAKNEDQA